MLAAVDLGSNSFRLLVVVAEGEGWRTLAEERVRVGLARGLEGRERLSRAALARGHSLCANLPPYSPCVR